MEVLGRGVGCKGDCKDDCRDVDCIGVTASATESRETKQSRDSVSIDVDALERKDLRRVLKVIESEGSVAKKKGGRRKSTKQLKTAADRVGALSKMDLVGKRSAPNTIQSRKKAFTGLVEIDEFLRRVNLLPPCVSQL